MADMNTTTHQPGSAPLLGYAPHEDYCHKSPSNNAFQALEMANEIAEEADRLYCLVTAIKAQLSPQNGKDTGDVVALRLVELLEDRLCDAGQRNRLVSCLTVLKEQLNSPTHAPVAGHA